MPTPTRPAMSAVPPATAEPSAVPSPIPTPTTAPTVRPADPGGLPYPKAALWLTNPSEGSLRVIDPGDNSTAVVIPTAVNPNQVVVGEGYAWALDSLNGVLLQIDLQTYTPVRELRFPQQQVNTLAVGAGSVWLGVSERAAPQVLRPKEEFIASGGVLRLDPSSGKTTGYAKSVPVTALLVHNQDVFALARGQVDTPLLRIDPVSLRVKSIHLTGTSDWLLEDAFASGANGLWLYSQSFGRLYHIAEDGQLYLQTTLGQQGPLGPSAILEAYGWLWLALPNARVLRIDPASGATSAEIRVDAPVTSLIENSGSVWAVSPAGAAAYRIDPVSAAVTASAALGSPVQAQVLPTSTAVRRATLPCEDSPLSQLAVGLRAAAPLQPALPIRLHKEPAKDSELTGYIQPGQQVEIREGPQCSDNWVWWRVKNPITNAGGWAAEGDASEYWLIPVP